MSPASEAPGPRPGTHPVGPDERARKRERIVDVLWDLQERRGWIDDDAVRIAAAECSLSLAEVDEIATFYNLLHRQPAGRLKVYVCDSIACELNGAPRLIERLSQVLGIAPGQLTEDGRISLLPIVCLGHCERAPCLLAGETIHGPCPLDERGVRELVERFGDGTGPAAR